MNFNELEDDIKSLEKTAQDYNITSQEDFESAKKFSQSVSHITIMLNKLMDALRDSNKLVSKKMDDYDRSSKKTGTGKKSTMPEPSAVAPSKAKPEPAISTASVPVSATGAVSASPSISLDDFDDGPVSEEDELTAELQKTLF